MKDAFEKRDWEKRLRPFERVWDRVQKDRPDRPLPPPPPPMFGPPPPPPPMFGPPPPPPPMFGPPPLFPPRGCCTKAVRFNPHGWRG